MIDRSHISGCAIDIGGTKTAAVRYENGKPVSRVLRATDGAKDLGGYIDDISSLLAELEWQQGRDPLGVAVAGLVSTNGEWTAGNSNTLTSLQIAPLGQALEAAFGPHCLMNDAASATLAEYKFGVGAGALSFVYLTVSTGVGGGAVVNGKLVQGKRGIAGHFGFTTSRFANEVCGCGRDSTFESVASGKAIAAAARKAGHADLSARDVFDAVSNGEDWAVEIVERSASSIAELCANLVAMLDPDCIALGGSVGQAQGYIERVQKHLKTEPKLFQVPTELASLGPDGPLLGTLIVEE